ncbi:MAG: transposase, partial [Planctomycetaceae bacterium]|nr:transposase [Planctomycetaceae bacterium]
MRCRLGPERASERYSCRVLGQPCNTQRYQSRRADDEPRLLNEMRLLACQRPRFGSARIYRLLTQRGWAVNEKRVHRLWKHEHMQVPLKQDRKRRFAGGSENGCLRQRACYKSHVWSYDFVTDRTEHGRQLWLLVVIDEY